MTGYAMCARLMKRTAMVTSSMANSWEKVQKNWQNAAHRHCLLKSTRSSQLGSFGEGGGKAVGAESRFDARVEERRGMRKFYL